MRRTLTLTAIVFLLIAVAGLATLQAASSYADPQFKAQWDKGEAITPNFWGPLSTAKDVPPEPYNGGQRTVQYFDKGRMELTNGAVTNGLLASEIIKGQIQTGDATFTGQAPPAIPIAGDPDNPGPTYATLSTKAASLLATGTAKSGSPVTATVSATGDVTASTVAATPETTISAFDDTTKHNLPKVFADYRAKAGLQTIGLAISEPFLATVKVAGAQKPVMIQVFERRVLTFTASNADAFKVEMGNIGLHYYQWRYPNGVSAAPSASASSVAAVPSATSPSGVASSKTQPTAPPPSDVPTFDVKVVSVTPTVKIGSVESVDVLTNGKADCGIDIRYFGNTPVKDTRLTPPKRADDSGKLNWTWAIGPEAKVGAATFTINCAVGNTLGTSSSGFTVSG